MIRNTIRLIPRYNWDYGILDLIKALTAVRANNSDGLKGLEKVFSQKPILTTSGRISLYAILKSLNLPDGSGIGMPLFCCSIVAETIKEAKMVPVFLDNNLDDYGISASDLQKKCGTISAVIAVHMFGHPVEMDSISRVSKNVPIIEDCAQALFSKYKDKYTGTLTSTSFFSFRSGKYLSIGEGGAIFCEETKLYEKVKIFVDQLNEWKTSQEVSHCISTYIKSTLYKRPWYGTIGYPIGSILDRKLNLSDKEGIRFRKIAKGDLKILDDRIGNFSEKIKRQRQNSLFFLNNIRLKDAILPKEKGGCHSNYYQFAIRFQNSSQRNYSADFLRRHGIDTAKYLDDAVDVSTKYYGYKGDCPNAELCSKTVLIIPNYYTLSDKDINYIVKCLNAIDQ